MSASYGRDKFTACRIVGVAICFCGLSLRVYTCLAYPLCTLISLRMR